MQKLGVALGDLGQSQLAYHLIRHANELASTSEVDVIAFYESLAPSCLPVNFACMPMAECWGYDGVVVATSVSTAEKVLRCPSPKKSFFYVWDLEWMRPKYPTPFEYWRGIYGSPDLTLVARGRDHQSLLEKVWNREVLLNEDFDLRKFLE